MKHDLDILDEHFDQRLEGLHSAFPAIVVEADGETVTVTPLLKVKFPDDMLSETLPNIQDVPILMNRTETTMDFHPVMAGTIGLCVCSDRSISDFMAGAGEPNFPQDARKFSLSDAYFIPGGYPRARKFLSTPPANATGKMVLPTSKLYFGQDTSVLMPLNGIPVEIVNIIKVMAEYIRDVNLSLAGAGSVPDPNVAINVVELIAAIDTLKA